MSSSFGRSMVLVLGFAVAFSAMPVAQDAQAQTDPIDVRRAAMKQLGGHMKAVGGFLKGGRRAGTVETVELRAESIAAIARRIPALFPKGTGMNDGMGITGAKPEIWADWPGFQSAARGLEGEAGKLVAAARSGDKTAIKVALGDLGKKGCGGCHRTFRQKLKK